MHKRGTVFNIQRFSTSDGTGIRTTVFLKGCPLKCVWCHNPESHSASPQNFYRAELCISCGICAEVCERKAHSFVDNEHILNRSICNACGCCAENCPANALELCGEIKAVEEIIETALRDKQFYEQSGGGITFSGGEPLMQYDFLLELLKSAKEQGLHTAIETSGYSEKDLLRLNEYTDLWLFDIKLFDEEDHKKYTGVSNEIIFKNLRLLDEAGANIILRCPIIPDINFKKEHFESIGKLATDLKNVKEIHLEPYHPLGISKSEQIGKTYIYENKEFLAREKLEPFAKELKEKNNLNVVIL